MSAYESIKILTIPTDYLHYRNKVFYVNPHTLKPKRPHRGLFGFYFSAFKFAEVIAVDELDAVSELPELFLLVALQEIQSNDRQKRSGQ
jgi:hypothetical protein